uniref:Uncharacterized protein n=1 Tax=Rhipicephalus zambeziensis TaxID=60191 RepID=A0A224YJ87_9ACAR
MTRVCRAKCLILLGVFSVLLTFEHAPSFVRAGNFPSSGSHHDDHDQPQRSAGSKGGPPKPPDPRLKPKLDKTPPDPHRGLKPRGPPAQRPPVPNPRKSKQYNGGGDSTPPTPAPRNSHRGMKHRLRSPPPLPKNPRHLQQPKKSASTKRHSSPTTISRLATSHVGRSDSGEQKTPSTYNARIQGNWKRQPRLREEPKASGGLGQRRHACVMSVPVCGLTRTSLS